MKRWTKVLLALVAVVCLAVAAGFVYVTSFLPDAGPVPTLTAEATPERLARGRYLFDHVCGCQGCHSKRDYTVVGHPATPGMESAGGFAFDREMGLPGRVVSPNITPAALASWSDGEIFHALTTGVTPDGRALFPMMPYLRYAQMSREDLLSVIAYMRTLPPVENPTPERELDFPLSLLVNTIPQPATPPERAPDRSDEVAYGRYLAGIASCADCHTPTDEQGQPLPGRDFAGGMAYPMKGYGVIRVANITPDPEAGIGAWTRERFIERFRSEGHRPDVGQKAPPKSKVTFMPWVEYAGMTDEDLGAIYAFLKTVPPVPEAVVTFTPES